MTDFRVGDRVRIREGSPFYGGGSGNPVDVVGTVDNIVDDGFLPVWVVWDSGPRNAYQGERDLEHTDRWVIVEGPEIEEDMWVYFLSKFTNVNDSNHTTIRPHKPVSGTVAINLESREYFYGRFYMDTPNAQTIRLSEILGG